MFRGTPMRYWLEAELAGIFGVSVRPSATTADEIYDRAAGGGTATSQQDVQATSACPAREHVDKGQVVLVQGVQEGLTEPSRV